MWRGTCSAFQEKKGNLMLLTAEIRAKLLENGKANAERIGVDGHTADFWPVVKLFTPDAGCTWLLSELDPEEPDLAFGLCDLGMGSPEMGNVLISELESVRGKLGLPIERDLHFKADKSLTAYADEARRLGHIKS